MDTIITLLPIAVIILAFIPSVWAAYDISSRPFSPNDRMIWMFIVLFGSIVGVCFYLVVGRNQRH